MRYAGLLLIILCASMLGVEMRRKHKERAELLGSRRDMCLAMTDLIRYERMSPERMVMRLAAGKMLWLRRCADMLGSGSELQCAWRESAQHSADTRLLSGEERELLCDLGERLGRGDAESELRQLRGYGEKFERFHEEEMTELSKKSRLYISCGTLGGIFIAILLL